MSKNPNRVLAVVIGLIIVAVTIVTVLSATKTAIKVDRASPVGSVQAYLKAVFAGHNSDAAKLFSPDSSCTVADLDRAYVVNTSTIRLVGSTRQGSTAEVRTRVEIPSSGPLGDFRTENHTFRLVKSGGAWLVAGIPWPLYDCGVLTK